MSTQKKSAVTVALLVTFLAGCANWNSIYRPIVVDTGTGALVDIKQRVILVSKIKEQTKEQTIVCVEPSPDALSSYASQIEASGNLSNDAKVKLLSTIKENSAFVGLRTQSIQLLRDGLYRLCEGYLIGAMDKYQYQWLTRRYQRYMLALLAIEQLTGTVRVPTIIINTESNTTKNAEGTTQEAVSVKEDEKNKNSTPQGAVSGKNAEGTAQKAVSVKQDEKNKNSIAQGTLSGGSSTTALENTDQPSNQKIQVITAAIKEIVLNLIKMDDKPGLCFSYLMEHKDDDEPLVQTCKEYFENETKMDAYKLQAVKKWSEDTNMKPDDVIMQILDLKSDEPKVKKQTEEKLRK